MIQKTCEFAQTIHMLSLAPGLQYYILALKTSRVRAHGPPLKQTNLSLACLHMPHPSNPLDDICTYSFDREHGLLLRRGLEDVWFCALLGCLQFSEPESASWVLVVNCKWFS
ncbi:hypothetical protein M404DRAFT_411607 [Pisolithus tinctorius Marx 270]|uniref:Uncharacterized protein n=1 Tax=Pisolithus tinctorius Marx 270 TaxID=870435 RepID=A0A0C3P379_PISTI|nr:hypothetical protein M404DRAFT_411607 [Pisolithus tinctorius Marx 270]